MLLFIVFLSECILRFLMVNWLLLGAVFVFCEIVHPLAMSPSLPFLPLMTTSVVCAIQLTLAWALAFWLLFFA